MKKGVEQEDYNSNGQVNNKYEEENRKVADCYSVQQSQTNKITIAAVNIAAQDAEVDRYMER